MAFAPPATRRRLSPRCSHLRTLHSLLLSSPIATHANVLLHDGTKKSHAPLHRRNTAFNARAYNTERPIAQSHAQPPSHKHPTTPQKREHPHTEHTRSPSPSTPPHTQVPSLSSSFSPCRHAPQDTLTFPRYHASSPRSPSRDTNTKDTTHKTRVRTRTALHRHTSQDTPHHTKRIDSEGGILLPPPWIDCACCCECAPISGSHALALINATRVPAFFRASKPPSSLLSFKTRRRERRRACC